MFTVTDEYIGKVLEAFDECYGGFVDVPDTFEHAVDTICSHMGEEFERIDFTVSILVNDGTVNFKESKSL